MSTIFEPSFPYPKDPSTAVAIGKPLVTPWINVPPPQPTVLPSIGSTEDERRVVDIDRDGSMSIQGYEPDEVVAIVAAVNRRDGEEEAANAYEAMRQVMNANAETSQRMADDYGARLEALEELVEAIITDLGTVREVVDANADLLNRLDGDKQPQDEVTVEGDVFVHTDFALGVADLLRVIDQYARPTTVVGEDGPEAVFGRADYEDGVIALPAPAESPFACDAYDEPDCCPSCCECDPPRPAFAECNCGVIEEACCGGECRTAVVNFNSLFEDFQDQVEEQRGILDAARLPLEGSVAGSLDTSLLGEFFQDLARDPVLTVDFGDKTYVMRPTAINVSIDPSNKRAEIDAVGPMTVEVVG